MVARLMSRSVSECPFQNFFIYGNQNGPSRGFQLSLSQEFSSRWRMPLQAPQIEGTSATRPYGHPSTGLSPIFSDLGDESQQDEEASLHTVLSQYQTFLVALG